jgi:hypothetical protein
MPAALQICVDASVRAPLNLCLRVRRRFPVIRRVVAGDSNLTLNPAFLLADDFNTLIFLAPIVFDSNIASVLHENSLAHMRETTAKRKAAMKSRLSNPIQLAPFDGLPPLHKLDQKMMRSLRKLADQTGCTVEDLVHEAIAQFVAKLELERELENKIISFPEALTPASRRFRAP